MHSVITHCSQYQVIRPRIPTKSRRSRQGFRLDQVRKAPSMNHCEIATFLHIYDRFDTPLNMRHGEGLTYVWNFRLVGCNVLIAPKTPRDLGGTSIHSSRPTSASCGQREETRKIQRWILLISLETRTPFPRWLTESDRCCKSDVGSLRGALYSHSVHEETPLALQKPCSLSFGHGKHEQITSLKKVRSPSFMRSLFQTRLILDWSFPTEKKSARSV